MICMLFDTSRNDPITYFTLCLTYRAVRLPRSLPRLMPHVWVPAYHSAKSLCGYDAMVAEIAAEKRSSPRRCVPFIVAPAPGCFSFWKQGAGSLTNERMSVTCITWLEWNLTFCPFCCWTSWKSHGGQRSKLWEIESGHQ